MQSFFGLEVGYRVRSAWIISFKVCGFLWTLFKNHSIQIAHQRISVLLQIEWATEYRISNSCRGREQHYVELVIPAWFHPLKKLGFIYIIHGSAQRLALGLAYQSKLVATYLEIDGHYPEDNIFKTTLYKTYDMIWTRIFLNLEHFSFNCGSKLCEHFCRNF